MSILSDIETVSPPQLTFLNIGPIKSNHSNEGPISLSFDRSCSRNYKFLSFKYQKRSPNYFVHGILDETVLLKWFLWKAMFLMRNFRQAPDCRSKAVLINQNIKTFVRSVQVSFASFPTVFDERFSLRITHFLILYCLYWINDCTTFSCQTSLAVLTNKQVDSSEGVVSSPLALGCFNLR